VLAQAQKEKNLIDVFFIDQDHELLVCRQKPSPGIRILRLIFCHYQKY
jgi:hypothetical protein